MFKTTDLYKANYESTASIVVNQGGTSSGKTYSILQVLFTFAIEQPNLIITICGQDIPNLKSGALRDALAIYNASEELKQLVTSYNKSDRIFEFFNGSLIEFKSYDDWQDAKSGKRDYLFINEANGISKNVFDELHLRTRVRTFLDYNPNAEFWVHEYVIGQKGVELLISDHRHNTFLDKSIHDKIEDISDPELYKVYARGLTGKIEGLIFRNYNIVDSIPGEARFIGYGQDFGFTNDPSAFIEVYMNQGELWINELFYAKGLTNADITNEYKTLGIHKAREIIADSAEPKSIAEIGNDGYNVHGAKKGKDSVNNSIDILKRYKLNITQRSYNLKKELNSYKWKQDKNGYTLNEPTDFMNHAIDA